MAEGYNAFGLRYTTGADIPWEKSFVDTVAALAYVRDHTAELYIDPK